MKLKLLFSIAILLSIWSISPDAWGLINRNHIFKELTDQTLPTPTKDTAVIVFVLPYELDKDVGRVFIPFTGSPMGKDTILIYDVTTDTPKLAGAIKANTKFAYEVPAGKYLFLSIGLLEANVVGGRTYYVLVEEPLVARFAGELYPVRSGGKGDWQYSADSFKHALEKAVLVETTPKAYKEFEKKSRTKYLNKIRDKKLLEFKNTPENELLKVTLNWEDGILTEHYSNQNIRATQGNKAELSSIPPSYENELKALESLRDDGIFTEEEFQKQKAKLFERE